MRRSAHWSRADPGVAHVGAAPYAGADEPPIIAGKVQVR
jgi:hypothetical protein